ncbi:MAG TPA: DUF362 domain-containing protein [Anaerolineaceae bacterium]|nr:DUF362 domain-containing protein [Anaerolineaceae bacterium]HPN50712.1 DUF362 domain-containing protein [Anaerolineaceae bacterium]
MANRAYIGDLSVNDYLTNIREGLSFIEWGRTVSSDTRIFIKPNLTYPTFRPGVMTCPEAIEAAIIAIKDYTPHIMIGDADSGGYNRFSMDEVYQATGLVDFAQKYGVQVVNLSSGSRRAINFNYSGKSFSLDLPRLLTDEIDQLVTMPVPKVHANTTVSLSFKNQWGCIPEPTDRLKLHPYFQHVILEVNRAVKTQTVIMDGTYGLNGNGPMKGQAVKLNWLMVADHPGSAAQIALEMMQIPLEKVRHLRYAQQQGWIPERSSISTNVEPALFKKEAFYMKRGLTDWPGYLAFNSSFLAYLAYFSPLAGFLHWLLYLVREPLYDYNRKKIV